MFNLKAAHQALVDYNTIFQVVDCFVVGEEKLFLTLRLWFGF